MVRQDPERVRKIRVAVQYLLSHGALVKGSRTGDQSTLAKHFKVSRQRVYQIVAQERSRREMLQKISPEAS